MKIVQFILSVLASLCAAVMLYGAITVPSPMKSVSITIMCLIVTGCVALLRATYKEMK